VAVVWEWRNPHGWLDTGKPVGNEVAADGVRGEVFGMGMKGDDLMFQVAWENGDVDADWRPAAGLMSPVWVPDD
jgi:hypothetical protein